MNKLSSYNNEFYSCLASSQISAKVLIKILLQFATMNIEDKNINLYNSFCLLRDNEVLEKTERDLVNIAIFHYEDSNGKFPTLFYLEQERFVPVILSKYESIKNGFFYVDNAISIITHIIIEQRKTDKFIKANAHTIKDMSKGITLPLDFLYKIEDFRNEIEPFSEAKSIKDILKEDLFPDNNSKISLSDIVQNIDINSDVIMQGNVSCLIKNIYASNFVEVAILYREIMEDRNVCYISSTCSSKEVIYKLLVMHSQFLDSSVHLNYLELQNNKIDKKKLAKVLSNFLDKLEKHLYIYDNTSMEVFNVNVYRKLLLSSELKFKETTGKNIDLVIVDTIENLRFEEKGIIEDNKRKIFKDYCNLFIRESKMYYRNKNRKLTVIISTMSCSKDTFNNVFSSTFSSSSVLTLDVGNDILERYSDIVITFIVNQDVKKDEEKNVKIVNLNGYIQIIKSTDNIPMIEHEPVQVSPETCLISYSEITDDTNNNQMHISDSDIKKFKKEWSEKYEKRK